MLKPRTPGSKGVLWPEGLSVSLSVCLFLNAEFMNSHTYSRQYAPAVCTCHRFFSHSCITDCPCATCISWNIYFTWLKNSEKVSCQKNKTTSFLVCYKTMKTRFSNNQHFQVWQKKWKMLFITWIKKEKQNKTCKIHFVLPLYLIPQQIKLNPVNSSFSLWCRSDMFFWDGSILQNAEETKGGRAVAIAMMKSL